ncbi:hypothetical protein RclHR1_01400004 [Rhizophagus clarus]|uniref:Uncharacterized protein n=1 Tax=Rhizophagus clarus TaxID=94130 RepID=A0A2Z6QS50_9GLOM|nr:hypothetical protein RclHR1_01400004 [Rhizophagus clarus]
MEGRGLRNSEIVRRKATSSLAKVIAKLKGIKIPFSCDFKGFLASYDSDNHLPYLQRSVFYFSADCSNKIYSAKDWWKYTQPPHQL